VPKLPGINYLNAVRAFETAGFRIVRHGKHIVLSASAGRVALSYLLKRGCRPLCSPADALTVAPRPSQP
jgi:hypothetical protein